MWFRRLWVQVPLATQCRHPSLGRLVKTHTHTQVTVACNKPEAAKVEVTLPFKTIFLMLTEQAGKVFEKSNKTARNAKLHVCLRRAKFWGSSFNRLERRPVYGIVHRDGHWCYGRMSEKIYVQSVIHQLSRWLWVRVPPPPRERM